MNELEKIWTNRLNEARAKAQTSGREDVAEYLALRATNDMLRQTSVQWLFDSLIEIAAETNRTGANVQIETENRIVSRMKMPVSAVRSPFSSRGEMSDCSKRVGRARLPTVLCAAGALAVARLSHFGISKHNVELFLVANEQFAEAGFQLIRTDRRELFDARNLQGHFQIFLG